MPRRRIRSGNYNPPSNAINNQQDPLGIGVITRGLADYWQGHQQMQHTADTNGNVMEASILGQGPLPDPNWQGFYQALNEHKAKIQAGGRRGGDPLPGLPTAPFNAPSTMWQPGQTSAVTGRPFDPTQQQQAIKGLKGVR